MAMLPGLLLLLLAVWACLPAPVVVETRLLTGAEDAAFVPCEPVLDLRREANWDAPPAAGLLTLEEGFSHTERWGVWALGDSSTVTATLLAAGPRFLFLEARPFESAPGDPRQAITVHVNGIHCQEVELEPSWNEIWLPLSDQVLHEGANEITLGYRYHHSPKELGQGSDGRRLAVGFRKLGMVAQRPQDGGPPPVRDPERVALTDGQIVLRRPGALVVPLRLPRGTVELALPVAAESLVAEPEPLRCSLRLLDLSGGSVTIRETGADEPTAALWERPLRLPAASTGLQLLVLESAFAEGSWQLRLEQPVLRAAVAPPSPAASPLPRSNTAKPDIVVIVADAARADHLGCYGYHHATTPNIDRLAQEPRSLLFRQVVAQASYTTCSVPTMITGLSPVQHGVTDHHHVLDARFTTLAEYLQPLGYHTVLMTANPYHSQDRGSHQGYTEILETWHHFNGYSSEAMDPHRLCSLATERLERGFGERPLLMVLHLVPPHSPYTPPAAFDLFGDPGYSGSITGDRDTLVAIRTGGLVPGADDLKRLVSLYDGNLRRSDDAIGRLLAALRARKRWPDTVVVITADHGEAFLEHGYQGHERTVYEEMIRVPLVLHLPEWLQPPEEVDTGRLASLGDIVPTLLGTVGVAPGAELAGVDLLAPVASVLQGEDRLVVSRTGGSRPTWAVRSPHYKAIINEIHIRELYDLHADPDERRNLAGARPLLMAGMGQLLRQHMLGHPAPGSPPRGREEGQLPEPESEASKEALRALGYLE